MGVGEEESTAAVRLRLYRGCDNCRHYVDRVCQITGEELTMVCDEWEEVDDGKTE